MSSDNLTGVTPEHTNPSSSSRRAADPFPPASQPLTMPSTSPGAPSSQGARWARLHKGGRKGFKGEIVPAVGEFLGTFLFLFLAFVAAQVALTNDGSQVHDLLLQPATIFFIAAAFSGGLLVSLWVFARVEGSMFNPAITLGLLLIRAISPVRALIAIPAQILGGIAAAGIVSAITPGPLIVSNTLSRRSSTVQGFFVEMLLTAQLVLVVFLLTRPPHPVHPMIAPVGISLSVFMAHVGGVSYTGTGINPARSLAPDVVNASFRGTAWIYYAGPISGALVAVGIFSGLGFLEKHAKQPEDGDENPV